MCKRAREVIEQPKPEKIKTLEIWALMGIHSQDVKHGGAWRLHVLASSLDHSAGCDHLRGICKGGSGKVSRDLLEAEALRLGVKRSTFYAWLADARAAHILNGRGEDLYLASQKKLAEIFLLNTLDEHKTTIPAKLLFQPGWKALVFAAYMKANHSSIVDYTDKPNAERPKIKIHKNKNNEKITAEILYPVRRGDIISRGKLDAITGINPRKQRRLSQYIKSKRNIAITAIPGTQAEADTLTQAARDNGINRRYFVFNDPHNAGTNVFGEPLKYKKRIAHTLPNRYNVDNRHVTVGARGRRRQILKGLRLVKICNHSSLSAQPRQAGRQLETFVKFARVYFEELPKPKRTNRHVDTGKEVIELKAAERFLLRRRGGMADVYDVCGKGE